MDGLPEIDPDLRGVDVERGHELDVAHVVAAEDHVHQPGDVVGGIGVAVVLDALDETARAVPDAGDRDTNTTTLTHACPLSAPRRGAGPLGPRSLLAGIPGSLTLTHVLALL